MLESRAIPIAEERSTTRDPLTDDDVRALLAVVDTVLIARGRSAAELAPADVALDDLKGRSGKYRAPVLQVGSTLVVGFSQPLLEDVLGPTG
ncbi:MAG: hypothetical protein R3344_08840 [Acidobacteriota bacterium]|nr:hypothetical protein [Acidobacteriota bacterium]